MSDRGRKDGNCLRCGDTLKAGEVCPCNEDQSSTGVPTGMHRLGDWIVRRPLGSGGMGKVYEGVHSSDGRIAAIKVARHRSDFASAMSERFDKEIQVLQRLDHPNIVRLIDHGCHEDGTEWMAMELVTGRDLRKMVLTPEMAARQRRPEHARVVRIIAKVARAMNYAHMRGVLHRDIKAANVVLSDEDEPIIVDFGLARDQRQRGEALTLTMQHIGTVSCSAPEVLQNSSNAGPLSEMFSIGVMFYQLLTGVYPWGREDHAAAMYQRIMKSEAPPLRTHVPHLSDELDAICQLCLHRSPDRRFASCDALADELERWLDRRPTKTRPPGQMGLAIKWVKRHPVWSSAILAAFGGLGGSVYYNIQAEARALTERQAEAQRLVWTAAGAHSRRDPEMFEQSVGRLQSLAPKTEGWSTALSVLRGLLERDAVPAPQAGTVAAGPGGVSATGHADGSVRVRDRNGRLMHHLPSAAGPDAAPTALIFTDAQHLLVANARGGIHRWNLGEAGKPVTGGWWPVSAAAAVRTGDALLITAPESADGKAQVIDPASGECRRVLLHAGHLPAAGGKLAATAARSGAITVWDSGTWEPVERFSAGGRITSLALSGDDRWVAWTELNQAAVYLKRTGQSGPPSVQPSGRDGVVVSLAFSGNQLAAGCAGGQVLAWDVSNQISPLPPRGSHAGSVTSVTWESSGSPGEAAAILSIGSDGKLIRHAAEALRAVEAPTVVWAPVMTAAWTVAGDRLEEWTRARRERRSWPWPDAKRRHLAGVSADSTALCSVIPGDNGALRIEWLDVRQKELTVTPGPALDISRLPDPRAAAGIERWHCSADGSRIAGAAAGFVGVWNTGTGKCLGMYITTAARIGTNSVQFSRDGSWLGTIEGTSAVFREIGSSESWSPGQFTAFCPVPQSSELWAVASASGTVGIVNPGRKAWDQEPVPVTNMPLHGIAMAADGHTIAVSRRRGAEETSGGFAILDRRQLAPLPGKPAAALQGTTISSLAFVGPPAQQSLGIVVAGRVLLVGGSEVTDDPVTIPQGGPPQAAALQPAARLRWIHEPGGAPDAPGMAAGQASFGAYPAATLGSGGDFRAWRTTFVGVPPEFARAELKLTVRADAPAAASLKVNFGAISTPKGWAPAGVAKLPALPRTGDPATVLTIPIEPFKPADRSGVLECAAFGNLTLLGVELEVTPGRAVPLPDGCAPDANGLATLTRIPVQPPADAWQRPGGSPLLVDLSRAELWKAGGKPLVERPDGLLRPDTTAAEESTLECTFELPDPLPQQFQQQHMPQFELALDIEAPLQAASADLNGARLPRPDAAPFDGAALFLYTDDQQFFQPGTNRLVLRCKVQHLQRIKLQGGIAVKPARQRRESAGL